MKIVKDKMVSTVTRSVKSYVQYELDKKVDKVPAIIVRVHTEYRIGSDQTASLIWAHLVENSSTPHLTRRDLIKKLWDTRNAKNQLI